MDDTAADLSRYAAPAGTLHYATGSVIGIVPVGEAQPLITAVKAMEIDDDAIRIITPDRLDDFELQLTGGGIGGSIRRFVSDAGGDLDLVRGFVRDLQPGRVAVHVNVGEDEEPRYRVGTIFDQHQAIQVNYLSRDAIETLNGKAFG